MGNAPPASRLAVRSVALDSFGVAVSTIFSVLMPWMTVSATMNLGFLIEDISKLRKLRDALKAQNLHFRKRDIARAITEAALIKGIMTIVTLGHDDVLALSHAVAAQLLDHGVSTGSHLAAFDQMDASRTAGDILSVSTALPSYPTETLQTTLGLQTAADVTVSGSGWGVSGPAIGQQIAVVGPVQAATERVVDLASRPVIQQMDSRAQKQSNGRR
ncbi:MAG: hypothetical protein M1824_002186 [Vezdaea acicularis]|nr:MAG: hypothetical protein M1824_002186 [Vezdaea acicularis]